MVGGGSDSISRGTDGPAVKGDILPPLGGQLALLLGSSDCFEKHLAPEVSRQKIQYGDYGLCIT